MFIPARYLNIRYTKWVLWLLIALRWGSILIATDWSMPFRLEHSVKELGELAWYLLAFTIFISLIHKLFPRVFLLTALLPLRKYTGVFAFLVAGSHGATELFKRGILGDASAMAHTAFSNDHAMVFGTLAFIIMLPLFITSTDWAVRTMGYRSWKILHRLTHVAFALAVIHTALIDYFQRGEVEFTPIALFATYCVGYGYLFTQRKFNK